MQRAPALMPHHCRATRPRYSLTGKPANQHDANPAQSFADNCASNVSWRSSRDRDGSMKCKTGCLNSSISCRAHRRLLPLPRVPRQYLTGVCLFSIAHPYVSSDHPRHISEAQKVRQCTSFLHAVGLIPSAFHRTCGDPDLLDLNRYSKPI